MTQPGDQVTIHKCDSAGSEVWRWPATVVRVDPPSLQVQAHYNAQEVDRFGLSFRTGDRFLETYFADRWYNIFAVYDVDTQALKGWYCNVSRPARLQDGDVYWEDLGLDIVVLPDATIHVLDQDEFERLDLTESDRATALSSLEELRHLAQDRAGPFAMPM